MAFKDEVTNWLSDFGFQWSTKFERGFYEHRWVRPAKWSPHFDEFVMTHIVSKGGGRIGVGGLVGLDSTVLTLVRHAADLDERINDGRRILPYPKSTLSAKGGARRLGYQNLEEFQRTNRKSRRMRNQR